MKDFKQPDLNAPRYRSIVLEIVNQSFYTEFRKTYPEYKHISNAELKEKIKLINKTIYKTVIEERDGVELPNGLGSIFIGTCEKNKNNVDYDISIKYKKQIEHKNWESDNHLAKIFYTNYEQKYHFKFHQLWGFIPGRDFKREVAKKYPEKWNFYRVVDNVLKIALLFRKLSYKQKKEAEDKNLIQDYNDLEI